MPTLINLAAAVALWLSWDVVPSWAKWTTVALLVLHIWVGATVRTAHQMGTKDRLAEGYDPVMASGMAQYDGAVTFWVKATMVVGAVLLAASIGLLVLKYTGA